MKKINNKIVITLLFVFLVFSKTAITTGYSYWDSTNTIEEEVLNIGLWDYIKVMIDGQFANDLSNYVDSVLVNNPNDNLQYVYSQSGNLNGLTATIENITVYDYIWDFIGIGTATPATTMGFVSLIDRTLNSSNIPIHPILTNYTTTPSYTEYNYFTSYDAMNNLTNNNYSLRLNYGVSMKTDNAIANVTSISFYAAIGQVATNDTQTMDSDRDFLVSISTDGINWFQIGSAFPPSATSSTLDFGYYSYNIPTQYLNQNIYLKIQFNGEAQKVGKVRDYSRLIIDELIINTD